VVLVVLAGLVVVTVVVILVVAPAGVLLVVLVVVVVVLVHPKTIRHGRSCASTCAAKVVCEDGTACKTHDSERANTRHCLNIQTKRAVARVRHAFPYGTMPSRLDM
jgi:hypothetical protein